MSTEPTNNELDGMADALMGIDEPNEESAPIELPEEEDDFDAVPQDREADVEEMAEAIMDGQEEQPAAAALSPDNFDPNDRVAAVEREMQDLAGAYENIHVLFEQGQITQAQFAQGVSEARRRHVGLQEQKQQQMQMRNQQNVAVVEYLNANVNGGFKQEDAAESIALMKDYATTKLGLSERVVAELSGNMTITEIAHMLSQSRQWKRGAEAKHTAGLKKALKPKAKAKKKAAAAKPSSPRTRDEEISAISDLLMDI